MSQIDYRISPKVSDDALNRLFETSWHEHEDRSFGAVLRHSLGYVCAFDGERLIGFVNIAWDGGQHGFLLDTTVSPLYRGRGIGTELVRRAVNFANQQGLEWIHVDYPDRFGKFYEQCGFEKTGAGLIHLSGKPAA